MILESVRIVADALKHEEYGVNAQIDTITRDGTDPAPPHVKLFGDITRDKWVATLQDPAVVPAIMVAPSGPASLSGEVLADAIRDSESVAIDVLYIGRDISPEQAITAMYMTFRAVLRTLKELMGNSRADDRTRNGVCVIAAQDVTWGLAELPIGSYGSTGALVLTLSARDTVV